MKKIIFILLILLTGNLLLAQDIIYKRNGDQIKSKITEVSAETIKYKEFDFQDGPARIIDIKDVFMIIYQNGKREVFTPAEKQEQKPVEKTETPVQKEEPKPVTQPQTPSEPKEPVKKKYFMVGTGVGRSYGFPGVRAQLRVGGNVGFGLHAGVGYFPGGLGDTPVLASFGLKFFPYKGLYINAQIGLNGRTDDVDITGYNANIEEKYLYGPSLLVGIDQVFGKKVAFGFNAGLGVTVKMALDSEVGDNDSIISPAFDLGFIVRF